MKALATGAVPCGAKAEDLRGARLLGTLLDGAATEFELDGRVVQVAVAAHRLFVVVVRAADAGSLATDRALEELREACAVVVTRMGGFVGGGSPRGGDGGSSPLAG